MKIILNCIIKIVKLSNNMANAHACFSILTVFNYPMVYKTHV